MARIYELRDVYHAPKGFAPMHKVIGYIVPDPDEPVTDIEDDDRIPVYAETYALADVGEAPKGAEEDVFFHGQDPSCVKVWPECYLHVEECRSGETWVVPITGGMSLNLRTRIRKWCEAEFGGEYRLDGELQINGDYYAAIYTGHRPPTSSVCWTSGGFYLKTVG